MRVPTSPAGIGEIMARYRPQLEVFEDRLVPATFPFYAVGADVGAPPAVKLFANDGSLLASFFAFNPAFMGGVRVTLGDVNADNIQDIIVGSGAGAAGHVKVINGAQLNLIQPNGQIADAALLRSFLAFPGFNGGIFVAGGRVNNDTITDIVVSADQGPGTNGHVIVFNGATNQILGSFFAFSGFNGGARVAAQDLNFDNLDDIIIGSGPGANPGQAFGIVDPASRIITVNATQFNLKTPAGQILPNALLNSFVPFAGNTNGLYVGASFLNADSIPDIIVGAGASVGGHVKTFSSTNLAVPLTSFLAFPNRFSEARVASAFINNDGFGDIVVGSSVNNSALVGFYNGFDGIQLGNFLTAFPGSQTGVFVG